jgi:peptidyl-prolyl cis-trans isomerase SurA
MAPIMRGREMKGIRLLFNMGIILLSFGVLSPCEAVVDRIVAVVNQEIITLSEVQKWSLPFQGKINAEDRLERREKVREVFRKVLDRIIEDKLIEQEAKKSGIKVTSKEIEGAVEDIKKRNNLNQEQFERALTAEGLTLENLKKEVEKKILRAKFINFAVKVDPKVGEKELREFFQNNMDRYRVNESYRPAHILFLIPDKATPEQIRGIRKSSEIVLERIRGGEDFAQMAREYSEDSASKESGGDLGYFKKGELLPALEREARRLEVGEVSGLVRTEHGFHILKLLDRQGGEPSFEEVKEKVQADYFEVEMEKAFRQFLNELKEKSVIEIKL